MPNLTAVFEQNAIDAAAGVWRIERTPLAVRSAIERACEGLKGIVMSDAEFLPPHILAGARGLAGVILKPDEEQLATAAVGVTEAFAGIASTGSVCVSLAARWSVPPASYAPYIVLLPRERIISRPRDLFDPACLNGDAFKRNIVVITGPSATADMGPLVRGVHGPHQLLILLLE